jgi:Na+-translocating ferredoxin:NAD+ oxidoreductase RnfD subunit
MKNLFRLSPKTYMTGLLLVLAAIGIFQQGYRDTFVLLILAVSTSVFLDLYIRYFKTKRIIFPSSAFISGMIIALVLSAVNKWYIPVIASCVAILQKNIIRYQGKHIFNPATFGLLFVTFIFSAPLSWWGQSFPLLIVLIGAFVCYKMKRLKLPIVFIASFIILNNLFNRQSPLDSLLLTNIFFVFVMLIEPRTSPVTNKGIVIYPVLVALFSFIFFKLIPQYSFFLLALALGNMFVPLLNMLR